MRLLQRRLQGHANLYNCHVLLLSVPCRQAADDCLICLLQGHANRYKRHIVPMLSLSVDFYVRVFVRVYTSPAAVKDSATKLMHVYQSLGCDSFFMQRVGRKVGCCHGLRGAHLLCSASRLVPEPWMRLLALQHVSSRPASAKGFLRVLLLCNAKQGSCLSLGVFHLVLLGRLL